ncbi:retention module-containing protein [Oceanimonas pelagia]|uniref:Retention module-containing protein n=1 Tax=Oceanimonas pelagia TaxID=3028314 RepID=A0AA50QAY8_9GAMM|nr:retention module-containing protein [Oceanimonas pelagia]WMC11528.1 retention module-containing protein [Oceanimonas pelagia]
MDTTRIDNAVQVVSLKGQAFIIEKDGTVTPVRAGQVLPEGALLLTDENSGIVYGEAPENTAAAAPVSDEATAAEAEAIQAAILAGLDPTKLFAAPAAGNPVAGPAAASGSGNAGFVVVDRTGDSLLAEAGFDTTFANQGVVSVFEALPERDIPEAADIDSIPEIVVVIDPPPTPPGDGGGNGGGTDYAFVEESALPNGTNPGSDNETATGYFDINTGNDELARVEIRLPGGEWVDVTGGGVIEGQYGTLTVTVENGVYLWRYDLNGATAHPDKGETGADDTLADDFEVRVTDDDGDQATAGLTVHVHDDGPVAESDSVSVNEAGLPCYNLVLIIDTSGSMEGERLALAKQALINLINSYGEVSSKLTISIITFASLAYFDEEDMRDMTPEEAIAFINTLEADGRTNYEDPLEEAQELLTEQLAEKPGYEHKVYFISDGEPNEGFPPAGWQDFVDDNGIDVIAVGVGEDSPQAKDELDKVGNKGDTTLIIEDPKELDAALQETVPSQVSGNVLANDDFGADGPGRVVSVSYGDQTYAVPEGGSVSIPTGSNGTLVMYSNGDFTYTGPADVSQDITEHFVYTMEDSDGDPSSATLSVTLQNDGGTQIHLKGLDVDGGEQTLDERHLPQGTDPQPGELTKSGTFSHEGNGEVDTLTIAGVKVLENGVYQGDAGGQVVIVNDGGRLLVITGYHAATGTFSYSYTLKDNSLLHDEAGRDSLTEQFRVFISDTQGATDTAWLDINIIDDIAVINGVQHGIMANVAATLSGRVDLGYGADDGSLALSGVAPDGLYYTTVSGPGGSQIITATVGDKNGEVYFTLTVYPDGRYDFELVNPEPVLATTKDLTGLTAGKPVLSLELPVNGITATFTELQPSPGKGGVNSSNNGMGIDDNLVDKGDVLKVAFSGAISNVGFTLNKFSTGDVMTWVVLSAGIVVASGTWTPPAGTKEGSDVVFNLLDPVVGSSITYIQGSAEEIRAAGFDELHLGSGSGDYRLLDMTIYEEIFPQDGNLLFDIDIQDGDGDLASTSLSITIEADGTEASGFTLSGTAADEVLLGSNGNDILIGGEGDDILIGGLGNNTLTGGAGMDTFRFTQADAGSVNIITDYEKGVDVVDLRELLTGEEGGNLSAYLEFTQSGSDTLLNVTPAGDGGDSQQIRFEDTNLMDLYGAASSEALIQAMVDDQTLQIDKA